MHHNRIVHGSHPNNDILLHRRLLDCIHHLIYLLIRFPLIYLVLFISVFARLPYP